jgi:hypothetical protein
MFKHRLPSASNQEVRLLRRVLLRDSPQPFPHLLRNDKEAEDMNDQEVRDLIYEMLSAWCDPANDFNTRETKLESCMVRIRYCLDTEIIRKRGE